MKNNIFYPMQALRHYLTAFIKHSSITSANMMPPPVAAEYKDKNCRKPENKPKESRIEIQTAEPDTATEPDKVTKKPVPATQKKITGDQARTSAKPVFKIQILVSNKILPKGSKQLKGVSPVSYYREKGLYKYTYGESTDYNKILRMKRNITPKFKDAFIIAFKKRRENERERSHQRI